jgi:hypothetical protein
MTQAFVYLWTHLPSMMWYVGSHTAKDCHPNDGYICHSKKIKPLIISNPTEWKRTIVQLGQPEDMVLLESTIQRLFDAYYDHDRLGGGLRQGKSQDITKAGKIPKNTQNAMKNDIKRWREINGPHGVLPEEATPEAVQKINKLFQDKK